MALRDALAFNLRKLLFDKEMSQRDLAKAMKVSHPVVSAWINKKAWPKPEHLDELAEFFQCPVVDLLKDPPLPTEARKAIDADPELRAFEEWLHSRGLKIVKLGPTE